MVDFSYLYSLTDFSLTDFIFGKDKNKENNNNDKKLNEKIIEKKEKKENKKNLKIEKKYSENEKKLILKLEIKVENYLYRKKVKELIHKLRDNYKLVCSANIPNLFLNIISSTSKKVKQYELFYEPILNQNIVFLPRKKYRNRKKLKFNFVNSKNEIFIEPQYKSENENSSFVNVINLREIKEEEFKNYENFQNFLKEFREKKKNYNKKHGIKEDKKEESKLDKIMNYIKEEKKSIEDKNELNEINTNYITDNELISSKDDLKPKKSKKRKASDSMLIHNNFQCLSGVKSILKERGSERIKNPRKISFGDVQFSF